MRQKCVILPYTPGVDVFELFRFGLFFPFFKKIGFLGILGPPYCGIGATIRIGREIHCLPYAGFIFIFNLFFCHKSCNLFQI